MNILIADDYPLTLQGTKSFVESRRVLAPIPARTVLPR